MKYFVDVNGETIEIEVTAAGVLVGGEAVSAAVVTEEGTPMVQLTIDRQVYRLAVSPSGTKGRFTVWSDSDRFDVRAVDERSEAIRRATAAARPAGPTPLRAPMPGLIVRIHVQVGEAVQAGQGLVAMEAMKMENELRASAAGTIRRILVEPGTAVEKGALLVELE